MTAPEAALKIIKTCGPFAFVKGEDLNKLADFMWKEAHNHSPEDEYEEAEAFDAAYNVCDALMADQGYDLAYSDLNRNVIWHSKLIAHNSAN